MRNISDLRSGLLALEEGNSPSLVVACSGGVDSLTLTWFLLRTQAQHPAIKLRIIAHHIDHAIRPEEETTSFLHHCQTIGIPVQAQVITEKAPRTGIQRWARRHRYRLLLQGCEDSKSFVLALGHHQGDQQETYLLRRLRRSRIWGQAGMSRLRRQGDHSFWRPWLHLDKSQIRAMTPDFLRPVSDPSNENTNFTRNAIRKRLIKSATLRKGSSLRLGRAQKQRSMIQEKCQTWFNHYVTMHEFGDVTIRFPNKPQDQITLRVVHALMEYVGGQAYGGRWSRFVSWWEAWHQSSIRTAERSRVFIQKINGGLRLSRSLFPKAYLEDHVWDRRYRIISLQNVVDVSYGSTCQDHILICALGQCISKSAFSHRYGLTPVGRGWRSLPAIIRIGAKTDLSPYCHRETQIQSLRHLSEDQPMHNARPFSQKHFIYLGSPIKSLDQETLEARLGLRAQRIPFTAWESIYT